MAIEAAQFSLKQQIAALRYKAMGLLARREQSRAELLKKLQLKALDKGWNVDLNHLLDELEQLGLQSDARFAKVLVRSKINNGYGEARIFAWAHQYGLSRLLVQQQLDEQAPDWYQKALLQKRKHCGYSIATSAQERSKQGRYLFQRGLSQEQIQYALQAESE